MWWPETPISSLGREASKKQGGGEREAPCAKEASLAGADSPSLQQPEKPRTTQMGASLTTECGQLCVWGRERHFCKGVFCCGLARAPVAAGTGLD